MSATSAFIATIERGQVRWHMHETPGGVLVPAMSGKAGFPGVNEPIPARFPADGCRYRGAGCGYM